MIRYTVLCSVCLCVLSLWQAKVGKKSYFLILKNDFFLLLEIDLLMLKIELLISENEVYIISRNHFLI